MRVRVAVLRRETWWMGLSVAAAMLGLFALGFDQGQLLSPVLGDVSYQLNVLHELVHDARHAAAFPCH
ncbi:MAG: CbtB-domain containing protein [Chloroflexi bacterium]|nr:CbtB-domain containing protein [Chloroflexota bacterium]